MQDQWQREYGSIVRDILANEEFRKLGGLHHHTSSCLEHVLAVSGLAYRIARRLGLNYVAAARGGLLHDFFLYDWRQFSKVSSSGLAGHTYLHPLIALNNARQHFPVSDLEQNIICSHMWPTCVSQPRCAESWIVILADKCLTVVEYAADLLQSAKRLSGLRRRTANTLSFSKEAAD